MLTPIIIFVLLPVLVDAHTLLVLSPALNMQSKFT
jgi:hypothetical protein